MLFLDCQEAAPNQSARIDEFMSWCMPGKDGPGEGGKEGGAETETEAEAGAILRAQFRAAFVRTRRTPQVSKG